MNGIDRRSQKVVCILEIEFATPRGVAIACPVPSVDGVYTVADFVSLEEFFEDPDLHPGITLTDFPTFVATLTGGRRVRGGWPIVAFRPVDERKTDIGELIRAGRSFETELAEEWLDQEIKGGLRKLLEDA